MASFVAGGIAEQVNVTATAGGTTTLVGSTASSATLGKQIQVFSGSANQTVVLPDATTMQVGQKFEIFNQSTGTLTLQFNGGSAFTDAGGKNFSTISTETSVFTILQTNGTAAGTWAVLSSSGSGIGAPGPTVQKFLSGSGTYTTPANVAFINVRLVGGGGGGGGGASDSATNAKGGAGGATYFYPTGSANTSLIYATGGGGGGWYNTNGVGDAGGTASVNSPAIQIVSINGNTGQDGGDEKVTNGPILPNSSGSSTAFGGAGQGVTPGGNYGGTGVAAIANSGSGGSGGGLGTGSQNLNYTYGGGGSSGGYLEAIITSPVATYSYDVGVAGTAGTAGTSGFAGGAGGSGVIIVTEYYFNGLGAAAGNGGAYTPTKQIFTSSRTYTAPANLSYAKVTVVGGGGSGGNSTGGNLQGAGGGGGGGAAISYLLASTIGATQTVTIGAGGATGGNNGGSTSFGSLLVATGGAFGKNTGGAGANPADGGAGGIGTSGDILLAGSAGGTGGQEIASLANGNGGVGGSSMFGGGGTGGGTNVNAGGAGRAYGGGGGGGCVATSSGGAGAAGVVIVEEFYNNGAVGTATNVTGIVAVANGGTGASTSVVAVYKGVFTTPTSTNPIKMPTLVIDSNSAYSTSSGQFTVPVAGNYLVSASLDTNTSANFLYVYKNGTQQYMLGATIPAGQVSGSAIVPCVIGDLLDVRLGTSATAAGSASQLSIARIT